MSTPVFVSDDPALTANTFIRNPSLQSALARLGARRILPVRSPDNVIIGAEILCDADAPAPSTDDDPPTEHELNQMYLLASGWNFCPHTNTWSDRSRGSTYSFAEAMAHQDARDAQDHDDDRALARLCLEG